MAKLIYSAIASLDGYVADQEGRWDWSVPDEEVHRAVNELERPVGTYLYGRRMYEVLSAWETIESDEPAMADFAQLWRAADKVVFSRTLESVTTARTTLEREFEAGAVGRMKEEAARDLTVGGPGLAAEALRAGLVDELNLFLSPVSVGGGTPALPRDVRLELELVGERRFANGAIHLHYRLT
jgi:dihydrofolate reductase